MKIIFDLDGVICNSQAVMMRKLSEQTGKEFTIDSWKEESPSYFGEYTPVLVEIFKADDLYTDPDCEVYEPVVRLIKELDELGCSVEVHSRCADIGVQTRKRSLMNRAGLNRIGLVAHYGKSDKSECDCDILVDDQVGVLLQSKAKEKVSIRKPWNTKYKSESGLYIADTYDELHDYVLNLAKSYGISGRRRVR